MFHVKQSKMRRSKIYVSRETMLNKLHVNVSRETLSLPLSCSLFHVKQREKATKVAKSYTISSSDACLGIKIVNSVYSSPSTLRLFTLIPLLFIESIALVMVE